MSWCLNCNFNFNNLISFWYFSISYWRFASYLYWESLVNWVYLMLNWLSTSSTLPRVRLVRLATCCCNWLNRVTSLCESLASYFMSISFKLMSLPSILTLPRFWDILYWLPFMSSRTCCSDSLIYFSNSSLLPCYLVAWASFLRSYSSLLSFASSWWVIFLLGTSFAFYWFGV